jgi:phosphopantothenoylcysteine decarboxylase / phosphopantothenate---cysteine ligase
MSFLFYELGFSRLLAKTEVFALYMKRILLGVSGSIAAYKAAHLTRLLVKNGAEVQVLMTPAASDFITPLTLSTLSKRPVFADVSSDAGWNNHVELGLWADAMLIAPCTATTLAKLANGICDNMLAASYLSARCPVFFAPAMDLDMWTHPATQRNVALLQSYGNILIMPEHGELASGLVGTGRMAEPESILAQMQAYFEKNNPQSHLAKAETTTYTQSYPQSYPQSRKRVLITSGPTCEAIDPVRFIGNRSSGKMGVALAEAWAATGAKVTLITGPTQQKAQHHNIRTIRVESAAEMFAAAEAHFDTADICIWAAAVADYRPKNVATQKIKKTDNDLVIHLESTTDIAKTLGAKKRAKQILIGFALETNNESENALLKLAKKNLDFIVLNSTQDAGAGFNHDTNKITIFDKNGGRQEFCLKTKTEVAKDIVSTIMKYEIENMK